MPPPVTPPGSQPTWPPPAPAASPEVTSAITVDGHTYAVVRLRADCGEATNLGGEHWTFDVDGMPTGFQLHGGGHGIYGDGTTLPGGIAADEVFVGRYYVADITLLRAPAELGEGDCAYNEMYNGRVSAVSPAKDLADARRQLAKIPEVGFTPKLRIDRMNYAEHFEDRRVDLDGRLGR